MNKKDFKGTKNWTNYYWFYYKWHMLGALFLAVAIAVCTAQCMSKVNPDYYILYYSEGAVLDMSLEKSCDEMSKFGEDLNGDGQIKITPVNCTYNAGDTKTEDLAAQKAMLQIPPGQATIWLLDEKASKIYYEADNIDIFGKFDGATLKDNFAADPSNYKFFDDIKDGAKKDLFIYIKKDKNGEADKKSVEFLKKLKK